VCAFKGPWAAQGAVTVEIFADSVIVRFNGVRTRERGIIILRYIRATGQHGSNRVTALCELKERTLLVVRSFFSSLISGTITLVFQGEGKAPMRRQ